MIKDVLHKHTVIGLNSGVVIEGFVQESDEIYFKVVELDNNITIVKIDSISFVRMSVCQTQSDVQQQPRFQSSFKPVQSVHLPQQERFSESLPSDGLQFELDEEGFAKGLPPGTTTMEFPFKAPISGQAEYEQPFLRGRR